MRKNTNLAVIIPCFNEAANVGYFRRELAEFIELLQASHPGLKVKFTVVNNNSNDGSREELIKLQNEFAGHLQLIDCPVQGYGAALKSGFSAAGEVDFIGFCDFDNTYPLKSFPDLLQELNSSEADMVYGARLHSASEIDRVRHFGNQIYVSLLKILTHSKLSDACSGMRVFKSVRLPEVLALRADDLSFSIELTATATVANWKLTERPILYRERVGRSKLSVVRDGLKFLFVLMRVRFNGFLS